MIAFAMTEHHRALVHAAQQWTRLDDTQQRMLAAGFTVRNVAAQEHLILPGATTHEVLFVARGLLRFYYPSDDGKESNKAFVAEGEFAGALAAANLGLPLLYGVEALEPSVVLATPYADFVTLMDDHPVFERLGRKLAELILTRKELRTRSLLMQSARDRYLDFVEQRPDLVQRVPLYHIASLLGITDVHLSRIRRDLAGAPSDT